MAQHTARHCRAIHNVGISISTDSTRSRILSFRLKTTMLTICPNKLSLITRTHVHSIPHWYRLSLIKIPHWSSPTPPPRRRRLRYLVLADSLTADTRFIQGSAMGGCIHGKHSDWKSWNGSMEVNFHLQRQIKGNVDNPPMGDWVSFKEAKRTHIASHHIHELKLYTEVPHSSNNNRFWVARGFIHTWYEFDKHHRFMIHQVRGTSCRSAFADAGDRFIASENTYA